MAETGAFPGGDLPADTMKNTNGASADGTSACAVFVAIRLGSFDIAMLLNRDGTTKFHKKTGEIFHSITVFTGTEQKI